MKFVDLLSRIFGRLAADVEVELVAQQRLVPSVIGQFQGDGIGRHARLALAIAHVDLDQFEQIARLPLQSLVIQRQHRLPDGVLRPAQHIPDRHVLPEQSFLVHVQMALRVFLDIAIRRCSWQRRRSRRGFTGSQLQQKLGIFKIFGGKNWKFLKKLTNR